jgi:hypothetical protein
MVKFSVIRGSPRRLVSVVVEKYVDVCHRLKILVNVEGLVAYGRYSPMLESGEVRAVRLAVLKGRIPLDILTTLVV